MVGGVAGVYVPDEPENEHAGVALPEEERELVMEGRFYISVSTVPCIPICSIKYSRAPECFPEQVLKPRGAAG
jgi:hypothetical protein